MAASFYKPKITKDYNNYGSDRIGWMDGFDYVFPFFEPLTSPYRCVNTHKQYNNE